MENSPNTSSNSIFPDVWLIIGGMNPNNPTSKIKASLIAQFEDGQYLVAYTPKGRRLSVNKAARYCEKHQIFHISRDCPDCRPANPI